MNIEICIDGTSLCWISAYVMSPYEADGLNSINIGLLIIFSNSTVWVTYVIIDVKSNKELPGFNTAVI